LSGNARVALELGPPESAVGLSWELSALRALAGPDGGEAPWSLDGEPAEGPLLRIVSAAFEDGTALGLAALQPESASGHGDEDVVAFIARPDHEPQGILEPRLSTEYDAEGRVRRAGLELWIEESGPPARGAGDRESAVEVRRGGFAGEAVRMSFRLDGVPGVAVYELLRPAS
jgi:hypothetical protein